MCHIIASSVWTGRFPWYGQDVMSRETRQRAKDLAQTIRSYHVDIDIDRVYHAQWILAVTTLSFEPKFKVEGHAVAENLMLQKISHLHSVLWT
jgi:NAD+ synthase (glutamine-hydrolysing)